jgi:hypothetical protein
MRRFTSIETLARIDKHKNRFTKTPDLNENSLRFKIQNLWFKDISLLP